MIKKDKNYKFIIKLIFIQFSIVSIYLIKYFEPLIPKVVNFEKVTNSSNKISVENNSKLYEFPHNINDEETLIEKLILFSNYTHPTNIIFSDYYLSKSCYDKSAFTLFEYYLNNKIDKPYYIINNESDFYKSLVKQNKTKNLILYNSKNIQEFYHNLFKYTRNAKIIINAYSIPFLQLIASKVPYIKFLKINHGIKHFKVIYAKTEFIKALDEKKNVICSSPFEYELLIKNFKYRAEQVHNASLVRYERFKFIKKNKNENKCILVSFTYRSYNKYIFEKSEYKKNLEILLNNEELIFSLKNKNIDLIYIPHHEEIDLGKTYSQYNYKYAIIKNQSHLEHCIEQCSLFITDFSSISFDFMFQNKPVLFYSIDKNDTNSFIEKDFMSEPNDTIYFGNYFSDQNSLIHKTIYYINNNFKINQELKQKYESVFFYKTNIIEKIIEIINNIVKGK